MDMTDDSHKVQPAWCGPKGWRVEEHYRHLPGLFYTFMMPEGVGGGGGANATPLHLNAAAARLIDLESADLEAPGLHRVMAGHGLVAGFHPLAQVYAGHQFGGYVPQLGDGRALMVAQVRNRAGDLWDLQLKGSGRTPYSRFGDGRAVLRSCIREYLCSEAMAALGIPTTRALGIVATGERVQRETPEPGAILTRLAPSHVRFGHFEYCHHTRHPEAVKALANHVIVEHFPGLSGRKDVYESWFADVVRRTALLIASWQAVGFAHGVMNTDNMSILGLTIDYGPFGFLDTWERGFICNHSDPGGRYAFNRQPVIALWNLHALASALTTLIPEPALRERLETFGPIFSQRYARLMAEKIGLPYTEAPDDGLADDLLLLMERGGADTPQTFRLLSRADEAGGQGQEAWLGLFQPEYRAAALTWLDRRRTRLERGIPAGGADPGQIMAARREAMDRVNPKYVLRNWVAETAIRAVEDRGEVRVLDEILKILQSPFADHPDSERYAKPPPPEMPPVCVSCSS